MLFPAIENGTEAEREESAPFPQGHERVLVVDDEPALAMIAKQSLERLGYEVEYRTSKRKSTPGEERFIEKMVRIFAVSDIPRIPHDPPGGTDFAKSQQIESVGDY